MREVTDILDLRVTFIKKRARDHEKTLEALIEKMVKKLGEKAGVDDVKIKTKKSFVNDEEREITYILDIRTTSVDRREDTDEDCPAEVVAAKMKKAIGAVDVVVKNRKSFIIDEKQMEVD